MGPVLLACNDSASDCFKVILAASDFVFWIELTSQPDGYSQADAAAQSDERPQRHRLPHTPGEIPVREGMDALSCLALRQTETAPYTVADFEAAVPARRALLAAVSRWIQHPVVRVKIHAVATRRARMIKV